MSQRVTPQDKQFRNILIGAAALAGFYAVFQYLVSAKGTSGKTLPLELTQKILKEIKYQMYANCISFAEGVNAKLKAKYPEKDLQIYLRTEISKIYDSKEQLILTKYELDKESYGAALKKYSNNKELREGETQIFDMLQKAVKGDYPDLTVRPEAKRLYNSKQALRVYYEMCEQIATKVWAKLQENRQQNPNFNSKDDSHFKKAIRELSIYEFKAEFLEKKGYKRQWGCPNMTFFKIIEAIKLNEPEIKKEASFIEKSYEILISKLSSDPQNYDRLKIHHEMQQNFQKLKNPKVQAQKPQIDLMKKASVTVPIQKKPSQMISSVSKSGPQPPTKVIKKQEQQEFDMQKMMMHELLSRSQQQPVQTKEPIKVVVPTKQVQVITILQRQPLQEKTQQIVLRNEEYIVEQPVVVRQQVKAQESLLIPREQKQQDQENKQQSLLIQKEAEVVQQNVQQVVVKEVAEVPLKEEQVVQVQQREEQVVQIPQKQEEVIQIQQKEEQILQIPPQQIEQVIQAPQQQEQSNQEQPKQSVEQPKQQAGDLLE